MCISVTLYARTYVCLFARHGGRKEEVYEKEQREGEAEREGHGMRRKADKLGYELGKQYQ